MRNFDGFCCPYNRVIAAATSDRVFKRRESFIVHCG
jgi:hypothetical protein